LNRRNFLKIIGAGIGGSLILPNFDIVSPLAEVSEDNVLSHIRAICYWDMNVSGKEYVRYDISYGDEHIYAESLIEFYQRKDYKETHHIPMIEALKRYLDGKKIKKFRILDMTPGHVNPAWFSEALRRC